MSTLWQWPDIGCHDQPATGGISGEGHDQPESTSNPEPYGGLSHRGEDIDSSFMAPHTATRTDIPQLASTDPRSRRHVRNTKHTATSTCTPADQTQQAANLVYLLSMSARFGFGDAGRHGGGDGGDGSGGAAIRALCRPSARG